MAKIDLEKLICSLAKRKYFSEEKLQNTLKEQGLEYKDGEIVEVQKPKFKVGDWIVSSVLGTARIIGVNDSNEYQLEYIDGKQKFSSIDYVNYEYDEWTIQDAKPGDVLAVISGQCIFLFDGNNKEYCHYSKITDNFSPNYDYMGFIQHQFVPATKEQRAILFQKMKEAGYEWDAEKKELKIIDWSKHIKYEPNGPSIIEENTEWSEEDEKNLIEVISIVQNISSYDKQYDGYVNWLKSIRQRIGG